MSKNKYLVCLHPLQTFFFGDEQTFNPIVGESNYFVRSNYFPQQTGLLGLMRYLVLQHNGKLNLPPSSTKDLIGNTGFTSESKPQDFGIIKSISPIFIRYEKAGVPIKNYIPQAKDWAYNNDKQPVPLETVSGDEIGIASAATRRINKLPVLKGYKAKNELAQLLVESSGKEWKYYDWNKDKKDNPQNGIFVSQTRVGIAKSYAYLKGDKNFRTRDDTEKAFYRQTIYKFVSGHCFAFYVDMEGKENEIPSGEFFTFFGGEKSPFNVVIKQIEKDEDFINLFNKQTFNTKDKKRNNEIILISDAWMESPPFDLCLFSINSSKDFRFIQTPYSTERLNYSSISKQNEQGKLTKGKKYNLLERGSVFWFEDDKKKKEFTDHLNIDSFKNIGYNHYVEF